MRRAVVLIAVVVLSAFGATALAIHIFPDVSDGAYYSAGVEWASTNGVMLGYANGNFGPNDPMTRGQTATVLERYDRTMDDGGAAQVGIGVIPPLVGLNIGGPIADRHIALPGATLSLAPGDYLIQVYGAFEIPNTNGGDIECDLWGAGNVVWPQLTYWVDGNANNLYDGGEGRISPNVLMPGCNGRHANVSGEFITSVTATTSVGLIAFGYPSDPLCACDGFIQGGGGLIVTPLGTVTPGSASEAFAFEGEGGG